MRTDERGKARVRVPLVLPDTSGTLRLHCGLPDGATGTLRVRATIRPLSVGEPHTILEPITLDAERPILLALCELPGSDGNPTALLDLELDGDPNAELWWIDVAVEPH